MQSYLRTTAKVRHEFRASAEEVFDAWFEPELLAVWMFDPSYRQQKAIALETTPEVGGAFRFEVERDGKSITYSGNYLAIQRPFFLQMTWRIEGYWRESLVTVDIAPKAEGCVLYLEHDLGEVPLEIVEEVECDWAADVKALARIVH